MKSWTFILFYFF